MQSDDEAVARRWWSAEVRARILTNAASVVATGGATGFLLALFRGGSLPARTLTVGVAWGAAGIPFFTLYDYIRWSRQGRDDAINAVSSGVITSYGLSLALLPRPSVVNCLRASAVGGALSGLVYLSLAALPGRAEKARLWVLSSEREISERKRDRDKPFIPWPSWFPVEKEMDVEYETLKIRHQLLLHYLSAERAPAEEEDS